MSRTPLFPCNGFGHGPVVPPPGLDAAREKRKAQLMKCGQCRQNFSAICALHKHLSGDSYHYDKEMMTAYPLDENSCPAYHDSQHSVTGTYLTESGVKQINMLKRKTSKTVKKEHGTTRPDKIISIQVYPDDNEDDDNIEADPANVDMEYFGPSRAQPEVIGKPVAPVETVIGSHVTTVHPVSVGSQAVTDTETTNADLEAISGADFQEITEKEFTDNIKKEIQNDSEVENDDQTQDEPMEQQVHIENDGQEYIAEGTDMTEPIPIGEPVSNVESMLNVTENPDSDEAVTALQNTGNGLYSQDQPNQSGIQPDVTEPSPFVMNKQMVIDLHSLETNADGSLKIVVGEKDAGIFRTPQGEEILKALKAQGKGLSVKNTQIVYNYSVPISLDGSAKGELAETNIHVPAISDSPIKSVKREIIEMGPDDLNDQKKRRKYMRQDDIGEELEMAENIDGLEAVVFTHQEEQITTNDAMSILEEVKLGMHDDKISKIQPLKANGGDLFVIDLETLPNRKDIRHDKYIWYNVGTRRYPKKKELMKKTVFKIRLPDQTFSDGFMKSIYEWIDETERYCIIHYTGYEGIFKPFPHGNCKTGKNFVRTCRSVIEGLKEMATQQDMSPTDVYKQVKGIASPGMRNLRAPRNLDQIKNHFFYEKKKKIAELRKAAKGNKNKKVPSENLSSPAHEADDIVLSPTNAISVSVLSPSVQGVSDSLTSLGSQAVSLLPPLMQVSNGQARVIQVSDSQSGRSQYTCTKISDSQSEIIQVSDDQGQVIQVSDDQGQVVQVSEDQGQVVQVSDDQGQVFQVSDDQGQVFQVSDDQGQVIQVSNNQGQIIQVTDEQGQIIQVSQGQQVIQLPNGQSQVIQVSDGQLEGSEQPYRYAVTISQ